MSPHGIVGPPDLSSPNSGNKCPLARPPKAAKLHHAQPDKSVTKFFYALQYFGVPGGPLGQSSPILAMMYIRDGTTNVPNFVLFWQPVYEISAAELHWFRWKHDPQTDKKKTVNDMSPCTMWRQQLQCNKTKHQHVARRAGSVLKPKPWFGPSQFWGHIR